MMSATAACCGELNMPAAAPATYAPARNNGNDVEAPTSAVAAPETDTPMIKSVRRPIRSDRYPLGTTAETLPIANVSNASPAMLAPRPKTSATNKGTSAIRNPNTDQPVAKLESSAARYAFCRNAAEQRASNRADEERRREQSRYPAARVFWADPDHQPQGRHEEHR